MLQLQSGNCHPPLFFMFFNSIMPIGNKDNKDFSCPGPEMPQPPNLLVGMPGRSVTVHSLKKDSQTSPKG